MDYIQGYLSVEIILIEIYLFLKIYNISTYIHLLNFSNVIIFFDIILYDLIEMIMQIDFMLYS